MAQTGFTPIQLYYSSTTTNAPSAGNLASGELAINITDGKLFYKDNANAVQVIGWKTVPATAGGTGQTSYAVGDLLYADTTTTLAKLPDVATGNALISGGVGVAPSWGKIGLTTHVSGVLPIANGGTNASTASITSFNNITGYSASGATGTTTTNLVFSTSPSITTPTLVGDVTLSTGNLVVSTSTKGITTGSAIKLGLGTNGSVTQATLFSSGGFSIGNTTDPGANNLSVTGTTLGTVFYTLQGGTGSLANGGTFDVTLPSAGQYLFTANQDSQTNGAFNTIAFVNAGSSTIVVSPLYAFGINLSTPSGLTVRITNAAGGAISIRYQYIRIG